MRPLVSIKNAWNGWLKKLADANQKQFGSEPPDCCKINRVEPKQTVHTHH